MLRFHRGRVAVEAPGRAADLELRGGHAAFIKLLLGGASPFESALQLEIRVGHGFNGPARELLSTLFPRLYAE